MQDQLTAVTQAKSLDTLASANMELDHAVLWWVLWPRGLGRVALLVRHRFVFQGNLAKQVASLRLQPQSVAPPRRAQLV